MRPAKVTFNFFLALTLVAIIAAPAYGWNSTGHSVIAYIAYNNLTKEARSEVDKLLRQHFDYKKIYGNAHTKYKVTPSSPDFSLALFMSAATWPDDIRSDQRFSDEVENSEYNAHRDWHFVEIPFSTDGTPLPQIPSPNMLEVIPRLRAEIDDPALPATVKAYDLVWLIHLVGDIHQPLHCATLVTKVNRVIGDAGGNLFKISYSGQPMSLHTYWDALFGTSLSLSFIKREGRMIIKKYKPIKRSELSEQVWTQESVDLAKSFVYKLGSPNRVTTYYNAKAENIAANQAALAGYRLAAILNEKFK